MNNINVLYQFNEKYAPFAGVSITSLFINNVDASEINVYVLGENLSDDSVKMLCETAEEYGRSIIFAETEEILSKFKDMGMMPYRGAYSVYLRLFFMDLPELRPLMKREGSRVLYIDADTIVEGSLLPLVNYDLQGNSIGMVLESIRDDYKVMIGMKHDSEYYNSGMILFDVDKWVNNRYSDRISEHIRTIRSSYIGDQDFLNIVCEGDVCRLPIEYNYQPLHGRYSAREYFAAYGVRTGKSLAMGADEYYEEEEIDNARERVVIYHCYRWLGEFPWNKGNLHPFRDRYDKYLEKSAWRGIEKEKADNGIFLRIEKILYMILPKPIFIRIFRKAHEIMLKKADNDARNQKACKHS